MVWLNLNKQAKRCKNGTKIAYICSLLFHLQPHPMKKFFLLAVFAMMSMVAFAQSTKNYQKKTSENSKERTLLLDLLRAHLYKDHKQEFVFVVNHFKVSGNYAWFMGDAQQKDGSKPELSDDLDCCHVEALFVKKQGKWYIEEAVGFSTDLWWADLQDRYPKVPTSILPNQN